MRKASQRTTTNEEIHRYRWLTTIMGKGQVIDSGHVLCVGGFVLSVRGFYSLSRELLLYSCSCAVLVFLAPKAPAAPKAPQQIKESRRSAPSALRLDGDVFEFGPLHF